LIPHFMRRPSGVEDNAFPRRGGWWGLAHQDDLRYVIIKSKAVSLICIYVHVISCARSCYGPLRFYFMFWVWVCPSPTVFWPPI
jgi:hypothetical protein